MNIMPSSAELAARRHNRYKRKSKRLLVGGLIGFLLLVALAVFLPWLVTHLRWGSLGVQNANEIGDTIGGIMGPATALIAGALSFFAFWAQYDANLEQRRQFEDTVLRQKEAEVELKTTYDEQKKEQQFKHLKEEERLLNQFSEQRDQFTKNQKLLQEQIAQYERKSILESFEHKFYMMLSIHRDNALSIEVNGIKGRKVFLHLFDELKYLYWTIREFHEKHSQDFSPAVPLTEEEIFQVAYLTFFFGVGSKSTPLVRDLVGVRLRAFVDRIHVHLENIKSSYTEKKQILYVANTPDAPVEWEKVYNLGVGHLRRLSHYVRHLYQTVNFVDKQPDSILTAEQKFDYVSNLRAQLSTFEQLLLFYNALSVLGKPWMEIAPGQTENLIIRYCLFRSVPLNSANFYKNPRDVFPGKNKLGKFSFEWDEIKKRMETVSKQGLSG